MIYLFCFCQYISTITI